MPEIEQIRPFGPDSQAYDIRDRSKLPLSGGTISGDVAVDGMLDVVPRRSQGSPSAPGWYRIIKFNAPNYSNAAGAMGTIYEIRLSRHTSSALANNEVHTIKLMLAYNNARFMDEVSNSVTLGFDKIRYIASSTGGYVDVHYSLSVAYNCLARFDLTATLVDWFKEYEAISWTPVADAPSGETVMTVYEFSATAQHGTGKQRAQTLRGLLAGGTDTLDLNAISAPGSYWVPSGSSNLPYGTYGFLLYFPVADTNGDLKGVQLFFPFSVDGATRLYVRYYINNQWYVWRYITLS